MTPYLDAPDEALLSAISQQQTAAIDTLYERHAPRLYILIYGIVRDAGAAEEVLQDTFLQIWYTTHTYTRSGVAAAWLWRIARNKALDYVRRVRRGVPVTALEPEVATGQTPSASPRTEQYVQQADCHHQLRLALGQIPPDQALCISLAYFEGMSLHQIALYTFTPLATVKSRMRRGLHKLATVLQSLGYHQATDLL